MALGNTLHKLWVEIGAKTSGLKRGLDGAKKDAKSFETSLKQTLKRAGVAFTAFAGIAVTAITKLTKSYIAHGVAIDKMVKSTGVAAETISGLKYAADQEHTSIEVLNKGLLNLAKTMDFAGRGTNDYSRAFESLGIQITNADGTLRKVEDVFFELSDAIKNSTNWTKTMADAQNLLGRAGKDAIAFFKLGSESIKGYISEAKELGLTVTDLEAKKLKALDDQMTKLKGSFTGLGYDIAEVFIPILQDDLIPVLEGAAAALKMLFKSSEEKQLEKYYTELAELQAKIAENTQRMTAAQNKDYKTIEDRKKAINAINQEYYDLISRMEEVEGAIKILTGAYTVNKDESDKTKDSVSDLDEEFGKLALGLNSYVEPALSKTGESMLGVGRAADEARARIEALRNKTYPEKTTGTETSEGYFTDEDIGKQISRAEQFGSTWTSTWEGLKAGGGQAISSLKSGFSDLASSGNIAAEILMQAFKGIAEAIINVINTFESELSDAFYRMFEEGQSFTDSMKELWENMKKAFKRALADMIASLAINLSGLGILRMGLSRFDKGGFASKGPGSLPAIPQAAQGMVTPSSLPGGSMLAMLHEDEIVYPFKKLGALVGNLAEMVLKGFSIPKLQPAMSGGGTTININVSGAMINDEAYWNNIVKTYLNPALRRDASGRV